MAIETAFSRCLFNGVYLCLVVCECAIKAKYLLMTLRLRKGYCDCQCGIKFA